MTAKAVSFLRSVIGNAEDDPRLAQLIGDLSLRSERFRMLWARQDVRCKTSGLTKLHPQVGSLDLLYEKLILSGAPGQLLVTHQGVTQGADEHDSRSYRIIVCGCCLYGAFDQIHYPLEPDS